MSARLAPIPLSVAALACALAAAPAARADGTAELEALLEEPVVSTASKAAETQSAAPATSTTITAEDLRRFGVRSLDEAINYLSLGMITQDPLYTVDIGARGVMFPGDLGNHVLLLVNGHTMNEPWAGTARFDRGAAIPLELIDHIEVILGPGSVLYGSNAMLGVINIITKRAKDIAGAHLVLDTELPAAFRAGAGAGYEFKLFGLPAEVTAQVEYAGKRGPAFTFGPQDYGVDRVTGAPKRFSADGPATGIWGGEAARSNWSEVPAAYARMLVGSFELNARAAMFRRGLPYRNRTSAFALDFDEPRSSEMDRWLSLDLKHRAKLSSIASLTSRLYGDSYDYQQYMTTSAAEDCLAGQVNGCHRYYVGVSRSVGLEEQVALDWLGDGSISTLLALDGRVRDVGTENDISDRLTGEVAGKFGAGRRLERALAAYVQQTFQPLSWFGLNAGVRFDLDERFGAGRLSPRAATAVHPWRGATFKVLYAEAFRSPTMSERLLADPSIVVLAHDLQPEIVRSIEGIVEQKLGTQRLRVGAFRSFYRNTIEREQLSSADVAEAVKRGQLLPGTTSGEQYQNADSVDSIGFDAAFEGTQLAGRLRYGLNLTSTLTRRNDPEIHDPRPMPVAPQFFSNARVSYDLAGPWPTLALAAQLVGSRLADRALDGGFPSTPYAPAQVALRGTISGSAPVIKGISYRLSVNYAFAGKNPYVVGPLQAATPTHPSPALVPVEQLRAMLGLVYDLPF